MEVIFVDKLTSPKLEQNLSGLFTQFRCIVYEMSLTLMKYKAQKNNQISLNNRFLCQFNVGFSAPQAITDNHSTKWHCASVTTQQISLLNIWERSVDTFIPSQVNILRIKLHLLYHDI
jgi:hypothetical protein